MTTLRASNFSTSRRHPGVAAAVLLAHVAVLALLLSTGTVRLPLVAERDLVVVDLKPLPKPADEPKPSSASPVRRHAEDAPKARRANPTEIVAPKPVVPQPLPPIVAAPAPGTGVAATAGASDLPGPGAGAGGEGIGGGRGGDGYGDGPPFIPSKRIAGKIKDSDYPPDAKAAGIGGTTQVSFVVGTDGRVSGCRVVESSGSAELDQVTCQLITERFRYRPARDPEGNAVPDHWFGENEWIPR